MTTHTTKPSRSSLWKSESFLLVQSILVTSYALGTNAERPALQYALPAVGLVLCLLFIIQYARRWGSKKLLSALVFPLSFMAIWFLSLPIDHLALYISHTGSNKDARGAHIVLHGVIKG